MITKEEYLKIAKIYIDGSACAECKYENHATCCERYRECAERFKELLVNKPYFF